MKRTAVLMLALAVGYLAGAVRPFSPALAQPGSSAPSTAAQVQTAETVGLLATLYLYQTYLNIGLLADCRAEEVYDDKQVESLLVSQLGPLDAVERQFQSLQKQARSPAERASLEQMQKVIGPLRRQGKHLHAYWHGDKESDAQQYQAARQESWRHLSALMGLKSQGQ